MKQTAIDCLSRLIIQLLTCAASRPFICVLFLLCFWFELAVKVGCHPIGMKLRELDVS